ncbi:MAG: MFS transporter [Salaquimonas sp.]
MSEGAIETEITEISTNRSRFLAVSGIIFSTTIMSAASGLLFAYVPTKLLDLGFETWVAASMTPAVALGGLFGCFAMGPLLRLSGHARIFMLLYALIELSMLTVAAFSSPWVWLAARVGYGFAINGIFILAQSWLHNAANDEIRGRVISIFYLGYVLGYGAGTYSIGFMDVDGNIVPMIATFIVALATIPVALTRLPQPEPPETMTVNIKKVWSISPVGLAGMFTVGGATMLMQSFAPIYAKTEGFSTADVGLLMLCMQLGLLVVQLPMGALSDRIDRRIVLLMVSAGACVLAIFGFTSHGYLTFLMMALMFAIWNGCNETLYSVSSALANDRAHPSQYVMLASTQMIVWSLAAFIFPTIATIALPFIPIQSFMVMCGLIVMAYGIFVFYRINQRSAEIPPEERDNALPGTALVVNPGDYSNPDAYDDENSGTSSGLVS